MIEQIRKWTQSRIFLIFLVLAFWLITGAISIHRTIDGSNDFDTFYEAGKAVLENTGVYYVGEYYQTREDSSPFLYPPIAACFFSIFAVLPMPVAAFLWHTLLLVLFGGVLILILQYLDVSPRTFPSFWNSTPKWERWLYVFVSTVMLIDNLGMAQVNIPIFFLCVWALVLWRRGKSFAGGLVLSCAIFLKLTPILFCFYFGLKRSWKLLGGVLVGALLLSLVFPLMVFGWETNRVYHRQWLGRMIKPMLIDMIAKVKKEEQHPLKKSFDEIRMDRTEWMLADSNQSLAATLGRLFLKDRSQYIYTGPDPAHVTLPYEKLPALGGGVSRDILLTCIQTLRLAMLIFLACLWLGSAKDKERIRGPLEISLVFLSITLLSPISRSHYFVVWIFAYLTLFFIRSQGSKISNERFLIRSAVASCFLYLLQALPYAEGIGVGTWANLVFWIGCVRGLSRK